MLLPRQHVSTYHIVSTRFLRPGEFPRRALWIPRQEAVKTGLQGAVGGPNAPSHNKVVA
jgi:hypothetical protein